jgi:hydrogenase expression/formation protein HypC
MCLAVPLKIVKINGIEAVGQLSNIKKKVRIDLIPHLKVGQYVMVHAGFAIEVLDERNAAEITEAVLEVQGQAYGI